MMSSNSLSFLVSNTLQSEFRNVLEERVMERLRRSGTNGDQTRQLIRALAHDTAGSSNVIRNDFSHLGIYNPRPRSDSSASSSTVLTGSERGAVGQQPITRTIIKSNAKEIKELKAEINELKSLVKLSFELTLDIQRSFKQGKL
jgi:hypothetical protein